MKIRLLLSRNMYVTTVLTVIVLLAAWMSVYRSLTSDRAQQRYFYDLGSQEFYADSATLLPPIKGPSDQEAVGAVVFSCGSCGDPEQRFVGFLEVFGDDGKAHMVRSLETKTWVAGDTAEGVAIRRSALERCNEDNLAQCLP